MINRTLLFLAMFLIAVTPSSNAQKKSRTTATSNKAVKSTLVGHTYKGFNLVIADPQFASTIASCKRATIKFDVIATFLSTTKVKYNFIVRLETNDKEHLPQNMLDESMEAVYSIKKELERPRIDTYRIVNDKIFLGNSKKHCFIIRNKSLLYMDDTVFKGELLLDGNTATTTQFNQQNKVNNATSSIHKTIMGHTFSGEITFNSESQALITSLGFHFDYTLSFTSKNEVLGKLTKYAPNGIVREDEYKKYTYVLQGQRIIVKLNEDKNETLVLQVAGKKALKIIDGTMKGTLTQTK